MPAPHQTTDRQAPPLLARTQSSAAGAIDNLLTAAAQLCDDTARTLDEAAGDAGAAPDLGRTISLKLHDAAHYMRRWDGSEIVNAGISLARRHPRLFVSTTAAVTAVVAYLLVSAPQLGGKRPSSARARQRRRTAGQAT